ncbi:sterol desaturase family protein [Rubrivirga marina]|uniref:Fatty acid hydroxylase n=1 Tax=Rubrivirga marina TaxID=1196024 RepID=A0A271IV75_9BACT|nr:sterol desaturase family protein [Rubrivirga marina]PAP75102.1 fatty acid hydroxylase [Rubrivirga marina]
MIDLAALQTTQAVAALAGLAALLLLESAHPFFELFRARRERSRHLVRNLVLGAINSVIVAVVFAGLWVAAAVWAEARGLGLLNAVGLPPWAHALGAVLALDAWTYAWHRMNHRVPFLWRFHRVHHSDAQMDVTTASRFHTGEIVLSSLLRLPLIVALGVYAWELVLYETLMFAVVQFHHANVALPPRVEAVVNKVIVTPTMHKVHHSRWQPETDSNYSAMLSVWDRLFRSFRQRERPDEIRLGLDACDDDAFQSVAGMLRTPFAHATPPAPPRRTPHRNNPHTGDVA